MKNVLIFGGLAAVILVGGTWWSSSLQEKQLQEAAATGSDIISRNGVHWHPTLEIYVDGEREEVPANIGVGPQYAGLPTYDPGMRMTAMHTHDPDGTIHLEFPALVTSEDIKLGNFFAIWGKDIMDFGSSVTMTVNGTENTELGDYRMQHEDRIVLRYSQ